MRINNVVGFSNRNISRNVAFSRKLKENEKKPYTNSINQAMDYLGIVNRAMIIHAPSFPADRDIDQQAGSPYNAQKFLDFIKLHGFNAVQLGPNGKLNRGDNSPYSSSIFAKSPLNIDFEMLTKDEFASLLSEDELWDNTYAIEDNSKHYAKTNYKLAQQNNDEIMKIAYKNYSNRLKQKDPKVLKLKKEFDKFQKENAYWLDYYSVLDCIASEYGTDYYPDWNKEDRELIPLVIKRDKSAIETFKDIKEDYEDEVELYKFTQFIADKESKVDKANREGITYIGDLLVGTSSFDELIYSDVFKEGYKIGAKYGGVNDSPQLWNIPVVDPDKLFNPDGSLGEAGKFIKLKLQKALSEGKNIRIDHAMGLVDPFLYKPETVRYLTNENGAKYPSRDGLKAGYLSELGIDPNKNYQRIIPDIIIPTMLEMGVNPKEVIWEDLGSDETGVFTKIFREKLGLTGINVLLWDRGVNAKPDNWAYIGCHDNPPLEETVKQDWIKHSDAWNLDYLTKYLKPASHNPHQKSLLAHNPKELAKAKWTELMRSTKNIQISFMDFFGINKSYNVPGTVGEQNWTLRLNPDYEDTYYNDLENNGYAINMPEILSQAVQSKAEAQILSGKPESKVLNETRPIIQNLEKFKRILKEKE